MRAFVRKRLGHVLPVRVDGCCLQHCFRREARGLVGSQLHVRVCWCAYHGEKLIGLRYEFGRRAKNLVGFVRIGL